ncbi:MAG TPA: hypothetical protein VJP86_17060, partial [Vicinamibacterales bacterium]|nr:hypothetical protein [Vicinamibacterales bacterium]
MPAAEHSDVNVRAILGFGAGLAIVGAVVYLVVWLLFVYLSAGSSAAAPRYPLAAGHEDRLPPEPRLQTDPKQDLKDLR